MEQDYKLFNNCPLVVTAQANTLANDAGDIVFADPAAGLIEGGSNAEVFFHQNSLSFLQQLLTLVAGASLHLSHDSVKLGVGVAAVIVGRLGLEQFDEALSIVVVSAPAFLAEGKVAGIISFLTQSITHGTNFHVDAQVGLPELLEHLCGLDCWLDTSMADKYMPRQQFEAIIKKHGPDRILFATDCPWGGKETLEAVLALDIPQEEKEKILWRNACKLLDIDPESL